MEEVEFIGVVLVLSYSKIFLLINLEVVESHSLTHLLAELHTSSTVSVRIKWRRESGVSHETRHNNHNSTTNSGLGRKTDLESKLSRVVVHTTAIHNGKNLLNGVSLKNSLTSCRAHSSISKSSGDNTHGI